MSVKPELKGPLDWECCQRVDELEAENERLTRINNQAIERMRIAEFREEEEQKRREDAEAYAERLRAELARWKPTHCGNIFPIPVPGEAVEYCVREPDHDGPHQAETGKVWVFPHDA